MADTGERYNLFTDDEGNLEVWVPVREQFIIHRDNSIKITGVRRYHRSQGIGVQGCRAVLKINDNGWPVTLRGVLRSLPPLPNRTCVVK